jgi:hypothetical protein
MSLSVALWHDKQLDELADLLKTADYSAVATFMSQNFLCEGSHIMTDPDQTTLRVTVNTHDGKAVDLSAGIFQFNGKISQLDSDQTINILLTSEGIWGTGQDNPGIYDRWSIICVKNAEQYTTDAPRWFVDDSVEPNTYSKMSVPTLINKAYYDIKVVHGDPGGEVPDPPDGTYWTIAEIKVRAGASSIQQGDIYDTADPRGSNKTPKNWITDGEAALAWTPTSPVTPTRILRLEFWSTLFSVDHDPATGHHRSGPVSYWHIGNTAVVVTGDELNTALSGIEKPYVTARNLSRLTDGSNLGLGELHSHVSGSLNFLPASVRLFSATQIVDWTDIDISAYLGGQTAKAAIIIADMRYASSYNFNTEIYAWFRKKGSTYDLPTYPAIATLPRIHCWSTTTMGWHASPDAQAAMLFVECASGIFQTKLQQLPIVSSSPPMLAPPAYALIYFVDLIGYII